MGAQAVGMWDNLILAYAIEDAGKSPEHLQAAAWQEH